MKNYSSHGYLPYITYELGQVYIVSQALRAVNWPNWFWYNERQWTEFVQSVWPIEKLPQRLKLTPEDHAYNIGLMLRNTGDTSLAAYDHLLPPPSPMSKSPSNSDTEME